MYKKKQKKNNKFVLVTQPWLRAERFHVMKNVSKKVLVQFLKPKTLYIQSVVNFKVFDKTMVKD